MEIVELKCINLGDTLDALQAQECKELRVPVPLPGHVARLPENHGEGIRRRLWREIIADQWGNQQFTNDSFYRVSFELDENDEVYEDDLSADMKKLLNYCRPALNLGEPKFIIGDAYLLFDVMW